MQQRSFPQQFTTSGDVLCLKFGGVWETLWIFKAATWTRNRCTKINKSPTVSNGVRASSFEIWTANLVQSSTLGTLKPVLNWANICSPKHTSDTSTNYDPFLNWTFSSPNMVRTVQTLLHSQLACNEMQASARTCSRQHDRKCRLKSSQYILIIPHRVNQLTTISFWVSETRLRLPQINK